MSTLSILIFADKIYYHSHIIEVRKKHEDTVVNLRDFLFCTRMILVRPIVWISKEPK
jgi:hypothetical protein